MGGFSPIHWIVIGIVALLLFGNRLPEVARSMGRAFKEFKRGLSDVSDELGRAGREDEKPSNKLQPPDDAQSRRFNDPQNVVSKDAEREKSPQRADDSQD